MQDLQDATLLVSDDTSAKFIARRSFLENADLCPEAAKDLLRDLWRDGHNNRMPWSHDGDALEQKVMEKIVVHVEGVTTRMPSLLSEAEEARSDSDTLAQRRNDQIVHFGLGDSTPLAVFLRTYVAAVRQDLAVPDNHVTYDLTVNYLAGTMYHAI